MAVVGNKLYQKILSEKDSIVADKAVANQDALGSMYTKTLFEQYAKEHPEALVQFKNTTLSGNVKYLDKDLKEQEMSFE
jgi:hypothetical protein